MYTVRITLALLLLAVGSGVLAQGGSGQDARPNHREVLAMGLYPPDIIMRHQQTLGITDVQRGRMLKLVRAFQDEVAELQWNLQSEQQLLRQSLVQDEVDAQAVLPRVERVLQMESEFKLAHFRLLIAVKNELSQEQIAMIKRRLSQRRK